MPRPSGQVREVPSTRIRTSFDPLDLAGGEDELGDGHPELRAVEVEDLVAEVDRHRASRRPGRAQLQTRGQRGLQPVVELAFVGTVEQRLDDRGARLGLTGHRPQPGLGAAAGQQEDPTGADGLAGIGLGLELRPLGLAGRRGAPSWAGSSTRPRRAPRPAPRRLARTGSGTATGHARSSPSVEIVVALEGVELDHEAGPAVAVQTVLDPHPAPVHADVLVDQRQPQPGALRTGAPPGGDPAGEPFEDQRPLLDRHAGPVIFHPDADVGQRLVGRVGVVDRDLGIAAAVGPGVVDQVGDHASQASAVASDPRLLGPRRGGDLHRRGRADGHGVADEGADLTGPRDGGGWLRRRTG